MFDSFFLIIQAQCSTCVRLNFDLSQATLRWKGEVIYDYELYDSGSNVFFDDLSSGIRIWSEGDVNNFVRTKSMRLFSTFMLDLNGGTFRIIR